MSALLAGAWKLTNDVFAAFDKGLRGNSLAIGMWLWVKKHIRTTEICGLFPYLTLRDSYVDDKLSAVPVSTKWKQ